MKIRVNEEYLDFDGDIEIESQIKLFEEIDTSNGDFSYTFELPKTTKNLAILGFPFPDAVKSIFQSLSCELIDDSGFKIYTGKLRVVNTVGQIISADFLGGNNDWFGLLNSPMSDLPLYKYDKTLTQTNITASWLNNSGLVFPIIDTGALITRSYNNLKTEDFIGCFYVKTLFTEIFSAQGIKINGDILKDDIYNMLIVCANTRSGDDIKARSCYVKKTTAQNGITSSTTITFQDETTAPFFDGSQNNFISNKYTADVSMRIKIDINLNIDVGAVSFGYIKIFINGVETDTLVVASQGANQSVSGSITVYLDEFDYVEIKGSAVGANSLDVNSGTVRMTPIFIYKAFGKSSVPNITQGEFVSNIIRLFNILPSYNSDTRTLTLDYFDKIIEKEEIDISDSTEIDEVDFSEFISDYAKRNLFKYQQGDDEDLRQYNISNFIKYGDGSIEIDNDYVQQSVSVVESDFTAPITYIHRGFDCSLERINFVELEDVKEATITAVTDSSGVPRFSITNADTIFEENDLVRIDTVLESYNGEWVITSVTSTYIEVNGLSFDADTTGTAILLQHELTTDDSMYLFCNIHNVSTSFFSGNSSFFINQGSNSIVALAFFNLLQNGTQINSKYKQGLSFGTVNTPLSYQLTLIEKYWGIFKNILSDPVMLRLTCYFKRNKFEIIKSFLKPIRIKTKDTNNLYYANRIRGYRGSHLPSGMEVIKIK